MSVETQKKRPIVRNAAFAISQVVLTGAVWFFLYRYLIDSIGAELFGVWTVVMSATSTVRLADLGFAGSMTKFVAQARARGDLHAVAELIETAVLTSALSVLVLALLLYPILAALLKNVFVGTNAEIALTLLPYGLLSLWLTTVASVFQSALDGLFRTDVRSLLFLSANVLFSLFVYLFLPRWWMPGLVWAQIAQGVYLSLASWLALKFSLPSLPNVPYRWNLKVFRQVLGYSANLQVASLATMLWEPLTKGLLGKFGGPAMVGYYEMASRLILQLRALIVSANQVLVPIMSELAEVSPERIKQLYSDNYRLLVYISVPIFALTIATGPVISELWLGRYDTQFVLFLGILAVAWFVNTLSVPAYFANQGCGELKWNTYSHLAMGLVNALLGYIFGTVSGGLGVAAASGIALCLAAATVIFPYYKQNDIPFSGLLPRESVALIGCCLFSVLFGLGLYSSMSTISLSTRQLVVTIPAIAFVVVGMWFHPIRHRLVHRMSERVA